MGKKAILVIVFGLAVVAPAAALAQMQAPLLFTRANDFLDVFQTVTDWIFTFAMVITVLMIIWASFLYITAGGDEKNVEKAKSTITYAVVGFIIAILAKGIPYLIASFFGYNL